MEAEGVKEWFVLGQGNLPVGARLMTSLVLTRHSRLTSEDYMTGKAVTAVKLGVESWCANLGLSASDFIACCYFSEFPDFFYTCHYLKISKTSN